MSTTPLIAVDTELDEILDNHNPELGLGSGWGGVSTAETKAALKALIGTIAEQIKRKAEIQLVESAYNFMKINDPMADEIWFQYDFGDGEFTDMRQDTLLSHLKASTPAPKDGSANTEAPND